MQLKHILKWIYVTFFTENALIFINGKIYICISVFNILSMSLMCPAGVGVSSGGVKYADSAGGFSYEDSGKLLSVASNRFIHW